MTAIIIDDEPKARSLLRKIIEEYCPEITIVDEVDSIKNAVKSISKYNPKLIFLDIEMPDENGFALFNYFDIPPFETIFCTAYSEYAIKAFEVSAIDYLLKPLDIFKIQAAIQKVIKTQNKTQNFEKITVLKENLTIKDFEKIGLQTTEGLLFVKLNDIIMFESDTVFTNVFVEKEKYIIKKSIKEFDFLLQNDCRFFRVHRLYIVNVHHIEKYTKKEGSYLIMKNKKSIPLAKEKKEVFDQFINKIIV